MMTNVHALAQSLTLTSSSVKWDHRNACLLGLFGGGQEEVIHIKYDLADAQ